MKCTKKYSVKNVVITSIAIIIIWGGVFCLAKFIPQYDSIHGIDKTLEQKSDSYQDKRFLAIGFDDFRESDFSLVYPLFEKYGCTTTYNRVSYDVDLSKLDIAKINLLLRDGNEIGDHSWFHCNYIYIVTHYLMDKIHKI